MFIIYRKKPYLPYLNLIEDQSHIVCVLLKIHMYTDVYTHDETIECTNLQFEPKIILFVLINKISTTFTFI